MKHYNEVSIGQQLTWIELNDMCFILRAITPLGEGLSMVHFMREGMGYKMVTDELGDSYEVTDVCVPEFDQVREYKG